MYALFYIVALVSRHYFINYSVQTAYPVLCLLFVFSFVLLSSVVVWSNLLQPLTVLKYLVSTDCILLMSLLIYCSEFLSIQCG